MHRWLKRLSMFAALAGVCAGVPSASARSARRRRESGATIPATRTAPSTAPLDQINKDNVQELRVAWRWAFADRELQSSNPLLRTTRTEDTPLMVNGVALHGDRPRAGRGARSGDRRDALGVRPGRLQGGQADQRRASSTAGLAYWTDGTRGARCCVGTDDAYLVSVDARTGQARPGVRRRAAGSTSPSGFATPSARRTSRRAARSSPATWSSPAARSRIRC